MRWSGTRLAAAAVAAASLLVLGTWIARDPFVLVRAEFARQRVAAGLSRETVEAAGHRWVYAAEAGASPDAPVLVMLHGFTGSKENWYPLARALDGRYALRIPDLPGWGESQRRPGVDYGFAAQAERVAAFIETVSPRRPVVLLGHSMGGGIAALVAARRPDLVARVGLLDAAGVRFRDNRFGLGVLAGKNPFAVRDEASLKRYVDTVFHDPGAKPWLPWPASTGLIERRRRDAAFEQRVLDRIGRSDESLLPGEAARAIAQPALLLWCRQDAVIDPSALDLYAQRVPHAATVLLDGCGHMSLMERPDAVAAAVVALVQQPPLRQAPPQQETTP
jgi:pimeloyl-ACP methyl ester carboxylesterase